MPSKRSSWHYNEYLNGEPGPSASIRDLVDQAEAAQEYLGTRLWPLQFPYRRACT